MKIYIRNKSYKKCSKFRQWFPTVLVPLKSKIHQMMNKFQTADSLLTLWGLTLGWPIPVVQYDAQNSECQV